MLRRTLILGAALLTLAATAPVWADSEVTGAKLDPQNTVYLTLPYGRVVIKLLPDVAP